MVRIFPMYHFNGQLVDTVDDMSVLTVTNNNKLLIAQDDYSVEVKDLLSDKKKSLFVFSTVEKVYEICHCASGNYVATVEGQQEFQKSDRLIVRIYTNWELDSISNETHFSSLFSKRLVRARIAGVVTPVSTKSDQDFLDMIEIPIFFTSPTLLTVCQNSGKLLIACGPTIHLFNQVFIRSNHDKTFHFMDFIQQNEVFQLNFLPVEIMINQNIIASYSPEFVSVFKIKKVNEDDVKKLCDVDRNSDDLVSHDKQQSPRGPVILSEVFKMIQENQEETVERFIDRRSLPLMVSLKGINDNIVSTRAKRLPFLMIAKKDYIYSCGKVADALVETLCDTDLSVVAESILALKVKDLHEPITKVAFQVLYPLSTKDDDADQCNVLIDNHRNIISINVLITTYQEGYLFYASPAAMQENLRCVAVYNFTSYVLSLMFDISFLHVLTQAGLETYNIPSLHSTILHENQNLDKFSEHVSVFGMHPFIGIIDFLASKDLIIILTSANEGKVGQESLPWTVYSLKKPKLFQIYEEMIETSNSFKSRDDPTYRYLSLESFLMLQIGLNLNLTSCVDGDTLVKNTHRINSIELAKIFFRSGTSADIQIGSSVVLVAELDAIEFIQSLETERCPISNGKIFLLKKWIEKYNILPEDKADWLINSFGESNDIEKLSCLILSNKSICRAFGHKAIPCLKTYVESNEQNSNVLVIYVLAIIYMQECYQNEAVKIIYYVQKGENVYRQSFVRVVLKYWTFLFDEMNGNNKKKVILSDFSSLLCENLPAEMTHILSELIVRENAFDISSLVQMFLMQFPCHTSVQQSSFILRSVMENVFSSKIPINYHDINIKNCLQMLARSYLSELLTQNNETIMKDFSPIFVEKLPSYVDFLPRVNNVNYLTLRRFQELIWSKMLDNELMMKIIDPLPDTNLKFNLMSLLDLPEFTESLIARDCFDAVLPFAKSSFNSIKEWQHFISYIQEKISELKELDRHFTPHEKLLKDVLHHLSLILTLPQLSSVLELCISKQDELYWNYIVRAQQVSYAKDVNELIVNTSLQLLQSNLFH